MLSSREWSHLGTRTRGYVSIVGHILRLQVGPGIRHANIGVPVEHVLYSSTQQAGSLVISSLHENKKDYAQYLHGTRILF